MNDHTSEADDDFYAAIGRIAISWAHLEAGLDFSVTIIHERHGGKQIEPEAPRSLKRKIKYLRRCLNTLPDLQPFKDRGLAVLEAIMVASQDRHDIIHGFVREHRTTNSVEAKMSRLLYGPDKPTLRTFTVTTSSALEHAVHANKLARQALELSESILGHRPQT